MVASPATHMRAAEQWRTYTDGLSGIRLMYPAGWALTPRPSLESSFKLSGNTPSGFAAELQLSTVPATLSPAEVVESIKKEWRKLESFKEVGAGETKWGRNAEFRGPWRDITFKIGAAEVHQRWYFFKAYEQNYMLVFTAPAQGWTKVAPLFYQILGTVEATKNSGQAPKKTGSSASGITSPGNSWNLAALHEESYLPIRMSYPSNWHVTKETHGEDKAYQFKGTNSAGHEAEMHLSSIPRGETTLDRFVEMVEDEHFKSLKNVKRVSAGKRVVNGLEGTFESISFTSPEGYPGMMNVLFFADRERLYCLGLTAGGWSEQEMRSLFDRVAGTIRL